MAYQFKTEPLAHQREVLNKIWNKDHYILAHDVGTGKTKIICDLIKFNNEWFKNITVSQNHDEYKILIVCPASVMYNWQIELEKHAGIGNMAEVIYGTAGKRKKLINSKMISIINYDGLGTVKDEILKTNYDMVIFDELHLLKSPKSIRSKLCQQIAANSKKRFGLTGTMILNNMMDVFAQFLAIDLGETFGTNFFEFRARFFEDKNRFWAGKSNYFPKWEPKKSAESAIREMIFKITDRRLKSDCLDLPDVIVENRYCELSAEQHKRYEDIRKELITIFEQGGVSVAKTALTRDLRLNQVTSGHLTMDSGEIYQFEDNSKMKLLGDLLTSELEGKKIIIWAVFRADIAEIQKVCYALQLKQVTVFGDTPNDERQILIDQFQNDPETRIFIGNPASAGTGITLTASDVAVFYSYNYNLGNYLQAMGRNHRKGSEIHDKITYLHLIAKGTVDEAIVAGLERKEDLADRVLNHIRGAA